MFLEAGAKRKWCSKKERRRGRRRSNGKLKRGTGKKEFRGEKSLEDFATCIPSTGDEPYTTFEKISIRDYIVRNYNFYRFFYACVHTSNANICIKTDKLERDK